MALGNRGILLQSGDTMQINNALVEEVNTSNDTTGYLLVSYVNTDVVSFTNSISSISYLQLNVNGNTAILNLNGSSNCLCDIQEGMWVDAVFSPKLTRSIPPQTTAFLILARRGIPASTQTSTAQIISVDTDQGSLLTGNPNNIDSQTLYHITNNTLIRNRWGIPIRLMDLRPGQTVRIVHANFQTASIPPQTTAFYIQLL
ncbi:MAG: hypothetical protein NC081_05315 [Roseburia sp.]|nr:hypothetical protein [Roseburia sp.]